MKTEGKSKKYNTTKIYSWKNKYRKACFEIMQLKGERMFRKVWKRTFEESKLEINIINDLIIFFNETTGEVWTFLFQTWKAVFLHRSYGHNHWSMEDVFFLKKKVSKLRKPRRAIHSRFIFFVAAFFLCRCIFPLQVKWQQKDKAATKTKVVTNS